MQTRGVGKCLARTRRTRPLFLAQADPCPSVRRRDDKRPEGQLPVGCRRRLCLVVKVCMQTRSLVPANCRPASHPDLCGRCNAECGLSEKYQSEQANGNWMTSSRYLVWLRLAVLSQPNATFPGIFHSTRRTFIINVYRGRQCFAFLSHLPRRLTRGPASGVGTLGPSRDALNWPQHQCRPRSALAPPRACSSSFHQGLPSGWRRSAQSGTFVFHWTLQCCTCTFFVHTTLAGLQVWHGLR